jgi:hypothetical protein
MSRRTPGGRLSCVAKHPYVSREPSSGPREAIAGHLLQKQTRFTHSLIGRPAEQSRRTNRDGRQHRKRLERNMYLHFDSEIFIADLKDMLEGFKQGLAGQRQHHELAKKLSDSSCELRKNAKLSLWTNCADCGVSVLQHVNSIWQRGNPVKVSLVDGICP